jgi:hypothetical protein
METLTTLERTNRWFSQYQPELNNKEWQELYKKLIQEELDETNEALVNNDLIEFIDWCIDLYWVIQWYKYNWWEDIIDINPFEIMYNNINYYWKFWYQDYVISDLIHVVADSNYTKVLELQTEWEKMGKVIKWTNFIPPTEWIKKIIESYNITFKEAWLQ